MTLKPYRKRRELMVPNQSFLMFTALFGCRSSTVCGCHYLFIYCQWKTSGWACQDQKRSKWNHSLTTHWKECENAQLQLCWIKTEAFLSWCNQSVPNLYFISYKIWFTISNANSLFLNSFFLTHAPSILSQLLKLLWKCHSWFWQCERTYEWKPALKQTSMIYSVMTHMHNTKQAGKKWDQSLVASK